MNRPVQVCLCGGGSLAHALTAVLGAQPAVKVNLFTRRPAEWHKTVTAAVGTEYAILGRISSISNRPAEVVPFADLVILTVPAFARTEVLRAIQPFIQQSSWVGSIPGHGGFDWETRQHLGVRNRVFGTHRTPYICRTLTYGRSVEISGISPEIHVSAIPAVEVSEIATLLADILNMRVVPVPNYLSITLTPANPVCHPCRLYSLFRNWVPGAVHNATRLFYAEWDDLASELFFRCDREIQNVCRALPVELQHVVPIAQHYQAASTPELTRRIRSIQALQRIRTPMTRVPGGYVPDLWNRYFQEDFPYGLLIIRAVADLAGVPTPTIDEILLWGQALLRREYFVRGALMGRDTEGLPLPANHGIHTAAELVRRALHG